jgi:hypothetical protein
MFGLKKTASSKKESNVGKSFLRKIRKWVILVFLSLLLSLPVFSEETKKYDYLILCPDSLESMVVPYATGLSKIGIRCRIISYQIGEFEQVETVKRVIRDEYLECGIEYVTLIGSTYKDSANQYVIPMKEYLFGNLTYLSDSYYGSMLDPDYSFDVHVGRIPFEQPELILQYLDHMESFWLQAEKEDKSVLLTGSWMWMKHCPPGGSCLLETGDSKQPPNRTENFYVNIDKADLIEQVVPLYFSEYYTLYRLYELEGLRPSIRKIFADDALNEENFIKYYNESSPNLIMLFGALDSNIASSKKTNHLFRKIWSEDVNQDKKPNQGELLTPSYLNEKSVDRLKSDSSPLIISDASFLLNPMTNSIGKKMLENGAVGIIGNTGFGITTYYKNSGNFYENGPCNSICYESLLLKSLQTGYPIGKALTDMKINLSKMTAENPTSAVRSLNLFGDPLLGFYNLPLVIPKTVINTKPRDGELQFSGKSIEIQFNQAVIQKTKDLQSIKESLLVTNLFTSINLIYTPKWIPATRTLILEFQAELPGNAWFCIHVGNFGKQIIFRTKNSEPSNDFDLPTSCKIAKAEYGSKDGTGDHIRDVTKILIDLLQKAENGLIVDPLTFSCKTSQMDRLYISWEDNLGNIFQDQITIGTRLKLHDYNPEDDESIKNTNNTFTAYYYNNMRFLGSPSFQEKTATINYDWGDNKPNPFTNKDYFSAKWRGLFDFVAGDYKFTFQSDDGLVIKIDGKVIIDQWYAQGIKERTKTIKISEGKHLVEVFYYEINGYGGVKVKWQKQ